MAGNNRSEELKANRINFAYQAKKEIIGPPTAGNNRSLNSTNDVKGL